MTKRNHNNSEFVSHAPCPNEKCGSSDAYSIYSDGHGYCFACEHFEPSVDAPAQAAPKETSGVVFERGECVPLTKRGINQQTTQHFDYQVGEKSGKPVQIANYYKGNTLVGQKLRFPDKTFAVKGKITDVLFGQHLWRDGGKLLVITEGEIDALTVSQMQGNKWPVVSVPNGAQGAAKAIAKCLDWVEKFETVVFMFDMDDAGQDAAVECAKILTPSKAKIARLSMKDPNELLQAGKGKEIIDAIWSAKTWRPDGIIGISDIYDKVMAPVEMGLPWWSPALTKLTYGRYYGYIYTFGAGTGVGKTDWLTQQIEYDINILKMPVAAFFLEQNPVETVKRVAGKFAGKRFHVPDETTPEELKAAVDKLAEGGRLHLFDHFGAMDWEGIKSHIRYLAHAEGVKLFYLDHLTALAAADEREEKVALEAIMAEIGSLVQELGIILHLVSHLATPEGKPHEEGGRVMIRHFKGSRAIGFWSFFMFGLERNQQADDPEEKQTTIFRILKDRLTGQSTGETIPLGYKAEEARLFEKYETPQPYFAQTEQEETEF